MRHTVKKAGDMAGMYPLVPKADMYCSSEAVLIGAAVMGQPPFQLNSPSNHSKFLNPLGSEKIAGMR